jgi:CRISPR-associated endoribonuclease Cas6
VTFQLCSFRFHVSARKPIYFPPHRSGNVLRGALGAILRRMHCAAGCPGNRGVRAGECESRGSCLYAQIFEPTPRYPGPSGLAEWPRPFVLRAAHLNGRATAPGEPFWFDVNLFQTHDLKLDVFVEAFARFANLLSVEQVGPTGIRSSQPISIPLDPVSVSPGRLRVRFQTPTELKSNRTRKPDFAVLFARAQDRIGALRQLYGAGPLTADFRGMRGRAAGVRTLHCELQHIHTSRRSSRTGEVHGLGGFIGTAEYEGEFGEFLPYLEAARWTGVGRQCVWGKGELQIEPIC